MNRNRKRKSNSSKVNSSLIIRHNTATLYGIYFATSNTDFLLKEKKTRFSVRPSVILNEDRKTVIFDYSAVKGTDEGSIFDGFFRGTSAGVTLTLDGGIETTCNFINETNGVPITNFADTYTIVKTDIDKKIIIATKETGISSTTAVVFPGNHFINLPQFTKTTDNESSTPIRKILNLLPSQSLSHLGIMSGSILEFKKTSKNNSKFTVKSIYTENGIECVEVEEPVTQEDATQNQIIMSVYGEEPIRDNPIERQPAAVVFTTAGGADCDPPVYGPIPTPQGGVEFKKWLDRDMKCCKCLVYAEGECNNDQCQICTAWTIWNRRRDPAPGGVIPAYDGREEDSYCDQSRMRGRFEGGWGSLKFNSCFCENTTNPLSKACERKADSICRKIGHANYGGLTDPTFMKEPWNLGANHFFREGDVPDYMDCNVQAGICKKVTGVCANCENVFYSCKGVPQPCDVLGKKPRPEGEIDEPDDTPVAPA